MTTDQWYFFRTLRSLTRAGMSVRSTLLLTLVTGYTSVSWVISGSHWSINNNNLIRSPVLHCWWEVSVSQCGLLSHHQLHCVLPRASSPHILVFQSSTIVSGAGWSRGQQPGHWSRCLLVTDHSGQCGHETQWSVRVQTQQLSAWHCQPHCSRWWVFTTFTFNRNHKKKT